MNWRIGGVCRVLPRCVHTSRHGSKKSARAQFTARVCDWFRHTYTQFTSPKCCEILIYDYDFMVNLLTLFLFRYIYKLHNKAMHSCVAFVWGRGKKNLKFAFVSGFFNEQFRQKWQWIHLMWIEMTIDIVQSFMCCVLLLAILVSFPNKNIKQAKAYQKAKIGQSRKRERKLDRNQFIFSINIYVST